MTTSRTDPAPSPAAGHRRPVGWSTALRAFFRYHGLLAPAVRLLRVLPIHAKIAVVSGGFVAAVLMLAVGHSAQVLRTEARLQREAAAIAHLQAIAPLRAALLAERKALAATGGAPGAPGAMGGAVAGVPLPRSPVMGGSSGPDAGIEALATLEAAWTTLAAARRGGDEAARRAALVGAAGATESYHRSVVAAAGLDRGDATMASAAPLAAAVAVRLPAIADATFHLVDQTLAADPSVRPWADPVLQAHRWLATRSVAELAQDLERIAADPRWSGVVTSGRGALQAAQALLAVTNGEARPPADDLALAVQAAGAAQAAFERDLGDALAALLQARIDAGRRTTAALAAGVVLMLAVGVYLLVGFHKVMAGGLRNLGTEVRRMADGDLSARPRARGQDEVAVALESLSGSLAMLSEMFFSVRQGVGAVVQASADIARGNGDLAERTDHATRQLEQVVAGVHLYMEQLDQSARRVDEAARLVEAMRLEAARSRHNMAQLQARMNALQGKSREIAAIVGLIDHIAFRTNVLALNASIEAAKAGESGRGFGVVAQEVRRLARRSAESARDIQDIVARSTEDIEQGVALADRTGDALGATDRHVARVHETMQHIVGLTRGGESNSRAILQSIRELDRLTDENNRLVDRIATASVALSGSGDELSRRVAGFKLG